MNNIEISTPITPNHNFRRIILPFALAETLVWAAYFYSFPAFLPIWESELGFSKANLTGAFTLSLVVSAVLSPAVGRLIDKGYGRTVFAGGAALASVMLCLLSQADAVWQFYAIWFVIGIAMSGSLYDACFAIVTYSLGSDARRAITLITLAAGFAGTVSFPSAYFLTEFFGWRVAIMIFSATVAFICLPLIFYGSYFASLQSKTHAPKASRTVSDALSIAKTQTFWFIGITFFLISINHGIIISHMLPIFYERGLDAGLAVLMASLIGPMQVAGRVMMMAFEKRVSVFAICMACFMAIFVAGWALYFGGMGLGLIGIFVVLQGAGYGVLSIIRPTVIAELLGRRDFGVIAGLLAVGFVIGTALAPTLGSFLWIFGDYDLVIAFTICIPLFALVSLVLAWRNQSDNSTNQ